MAVSSSSQRLGFSRVMYHALRIAHHPKHSFPAIVIFSFLFLIIGCTERGTEPHVHPEGWGNRESENFHGKKIMSSGIIMCKSCHDWEDDSGGTSGISCTGCHAGGPSGHPERLSFITPDSNNYHGRIFWENGWVFDKCKTCHGEDWDEAESSGGVVELPCSTCHSEGIGACNTCHGVWASTYSGISFPPKDIQNHSESTLVSVGAHESHMDSDLSVVSCDQCHLVPEDYSDVGHLGPDNIAEITFGLIATHNGEVGPVWNRSDATCSDVYCHNSGEPKWTQVDGTYSACGSCHSLPPDEGAHGVHAVILELDCSTCHNGYSGSNETVKISTHINGEEDIDIDEAFGGMFNPDNESCSGVRCHGESNTTPGWYDSVELSCISCHGGQENQTGAPPSDLDGNDHPTYLGVGAHTVHLSGNEFSDGVACNECHIVPDSVLSTGHFDTDLIAEVTWGDLATINGSIEPVWDTVMVSCGDTYCHGNFTFGDVSGNNATAVWTNPGSVVCGSCHGIPPTGHMGDYNLEQCTLCHSSVVNSEGTIIDKTKHINGEGDF